MWLLCAAQDESFAARKFPSYAMQWSRRRTRAPSCSICQNWSLSTPVGSAHWCSCTTGLRIAAYILSWFIHGVSRDVAGGSHALHAQLEIVGIRGIFQSRFVIHQSGLEQIPQRLIKRLHAVL